MKKILSSLFLLAFFVQDSSAQTNLTRSKGIGVSVIMNDFVTPQRIRSTSLATVVREEKFAKFKEMNPGLAITYYKGFTPHIDFAATVGGSFVNMTLGGRTQERDNLLLAVDASAHLKMFTEEMKFNPYLIAGVGATKYTDIFGAFVPVGGGIKGAFINGSQLFVQLQYRIPVTPDAIDYHLQLSLGVSGMLGKSKPPVVKEVPPPPADTDGDGIIDAEDACPTVVGTVKYKGCPVPDTDKDGVNDEEDKCPSVPGLAKYNGCPVPDTDKDGVNDEEDKCPNQAGVARYQGCPVPDQDNDGVNDEEDRCPTVAGIASNGGCPEVPQEMVKKMEYAAKRIFFVTGSAKLSSKSDAALNEVVKVLSEDKDVKLSIEGHTDNVGKAPYNQTLSEKRAASVKDYLVSKGVGESRLTSEGFGMDKPVGNNKTAAGRAQNRRVELKLSY